MHNIIYPLKDTTIYSKYPEVNTGLDEILEITKEVSSSLYSYRGNWISSSYYKRYEYIFMPESNDYYFSVAENINETPGTSSYWATFEPASIRENSRILIKFDLNNFDLTSIASASIVYLNLYTCIARKVPTEYTLEAFPISGSWEMGVGNFTDKLTIDGATWNRRSSTLQWNSAGGNDYDTSYSASQNFNFAPTDIRMDVTGIFNYWRQNNNNEGFIIKRTDVQEEDAIKYGSLSFYSLDTHTVYLPTLEIAYDDHIYNTSSFIMSSSVTQSSYLSSSVSQSFVVVESVNISGSLIFYLSASVSESQIDITGSGLIVSATISYATESVTGNQVLRDNNNAPYLSSSVYYYLSASVSESDSNVISGSIYASASIGYISQGVGFNYILYTTQSIATETIIFTPATSSIIIDWPANVTSSLASGSINVAMKNFKPEYTYNTKVRFQINVKPSYVAKTFYEQLRIGEIYYLPDNSIYYSIRDAYSNRIMIPFSDYTKVNLDETGHYFDVLLSGFMPERFYKIIFKVILDGETQYFDTYNQFKVIK